jgi:hypothetical protein
VVVGAAISGGGRWETILLSRSFGGNATGTRDLTLGSLIAVRERVNVLWERVNFPTIDGMSTVACGTPGNGGR